MKASLALFAVATCVACAHRQTTVASPPQAEPTVEIVAAVPPPAPAPAPTSRDIYQITLLTVAPMAQRGEFVAADSALSAFARNNQGSCEASEAGYVRALLRLSPSNINAKAETALPLLDSYLGSTCLTPGRAAEVLLLRRVAADMMRQNFAGDSASSEEIRKLKEQLELAKKELDRLKMRIIPPNL